MTSRTNAAKVLEIIEADASSGSDVAQNFQALITFAQTAGAAALVTTLPGAGQLLGAVAVSLGAAGQVIKAVSAWRSRRHQIPVYDQFQVLFYTECHRAYLEALSEQLAKLQPSGKPDKPKAKDLERLGRAVLDADVTYLLCVEPGEVELPLFSAYDEWLKSILAAYGVSSGYSLAYEVSKNARLRLNIALSQQTETAAWMRDFLALSHQARSGQVLTTLSGAATALADWTTEYAGYGRKRQESAWASYRKNLMRLPDQRETMFAEDFGVRKVFVAPQATYTVIGTSKRPHHIDNLPKMLGALVSDRLEPGEIRILCGGPGSGKSTVCRMLASELAENQAMHPVFLRLRRMKEGADIVAFVEESLRNEGVIDRVAELRDLPNLVLILDGFDELVLASRPRLRHFFNVLREELTNGPLRSARAIVSGRDTLFPGGDGLQLGSHVLTLLPFDRARVAAWGEKWRHLHPRGRASDFRPEELLPTDQSTGIKPLQYLASWPLTLHLLARVHTSGTLSLRPDKRGDVEKAFLYRSIVADTARRQIMQAEGQGRFDLAQMQKFLRFLAWTMYSRETDSLEFDEVIPLVRRFYPAATETEIAEITDVAIVNSPELTKGEETGCEFVHKSFSEYLVAEHIAETVEKIAFKAAEYGQEGPTWRMSPTDTTSELAEVFASRLLTPEVQEMLEPMLGCAQVFFGNVSIEKVRTALVRDDGLARIIERLEMMLRLFSQGQHIDLIARVGKDDGLAETTFEAMANYCAGIMMVGTAAARCATAIGRASGKKVYFSGEPVPGAFWRCIGILQAGGLVINDSLGYRLFTQMTLSEPSAHPAPRAYPKTVSESSIPLRFNALQRLSGFDPDITSSVYDLMLLNVEQLIVNLLYLVASPFPIRAGREDDWSSRHMRANMFDFLQEAASSLRFCEEVFGRAGISGDYRLQSLPGEIDHLIFTQRRMADSPSPEGQDRELYYRLRSILEQLSLQNRITSHEVSPYRSRRANVLYELLHYGETEHMRRLPPYLEPPAPRPGS